MKVMPLQKRGVSDSRLVLGCMGLAENWEPVPLTAEDRKRTAEAVEAALSIGITMFDHADIYCRTKSEAAFGEWLAAHPGMREKLVLQSKCGIILRDDVLPEHYNFSRDHILQSVDGILKRLGTEYLDILLLHRPDPLMEPDEIAEAFLKLSSAGKVRHFGVSNMGASQMIFLQRAISQPLVVNQLRLGLGHLDFLNQGLWVNRRDGVDVNFGEGILEYCQMEDIQLQGWGPLEQGKYTGRPVSPGDETTARTAAFVNELAGRMETTPESVVLGWLMKHPANIQPILGSVNPKRIIACQDSAKVAEQMTREDWYKLYSRARGDAMP
ncbi:aldo/keto reductase [Gorillibacterium timonense]|uniref:aldo/keto reductase n=1 Tax=Gorillibacterium timonense TaxID=1689269 RepID=UPI00071C2030|nr:aldo/keto reductase [Gorillibacterium timonense]